ncbi:LURP-one-related/scramblase family protein [Corynebacterium lactis]|uniref:Scramblase n=1 Tax=Corynebacterium lactis RW2-5 TaxID=1408189 RepID=A0A0K2H3E9_9CORY|nr:phospholipid scramblase-related protein [Corynebacterium lactis]ALA68468.1 hypothetical protein CLAC_03860 [Corynebacterium lactis RW2-5]
MGAPGFHPLLENNTLVIRQTRTFLRDDFFIFDTHGRKIATIVESGSELKKLLGFSRRFHVAEIDEAGSIREPLFQVSDPYDFFGDTFEISSCPDGGHLASVRRKLISLTARLTLTVEGLGNVDIDGGFMAFDFTLRAGSREIARIDKKWNGLAKEFFGKQIYALHLSPQLDSRQRMAVIGSVLTIDLVKSKAKSFGQSFFD